MNQEQKRKWPPVTIIARTEEYRKKQLAVGNKALAKLIARAERDVAKLRALQAFAERAAAEPAILDNPEERRNWKPGYDALGNAFSDAGRSQYMCNSGKISAAAEEALGLVFGEYVLVVGGCISDRPCAFPTSSARKEIADHGLAPESERI